MERLLLHAAASTPTECLDLRHMLAGCCDACLLCERTMPPWGLNRLKGSSAEGDISLKTQHSLDADLTQGDACCLVQHCRNVCELPESLRTVH